MQNNLRSSFVDSLRGVAVALMVIYHFCYDLTYFRIVYFDFYQNYFWLAFRSFIVSLFLIIVGVSLYLAHAKTLRWHQALKRLLILLSCSLLISLVSYFIFPDRIIYFGIIHFITVASLIALFFVRYPFYSLIIGIILIIAGNAVSHPFFNQPLIHWLGMMTFKPRTEDYVPLLPWLGVVLCGISIGHLLKNTRPGQSLLALKSPLTEISLLNWAGRRSLWIYMLHQPLLFALLWAVTTVF